MAVGNSQLRSSSLQALEVWPWACITLMRYSYEDSVGLNLFCFSCDIYIFLSLLTGTCTVCRHDDWQLQCQSKVSYHLSSRFSWDGSRFSRDVSRSSRESLKHLVWHMLHVRNQLCVTIVALQFFAKSRGPSHRRYMYALMHWSFARFISNKHRMYEVIIYIRHWISSSENTIVFNSKLQKKGNSS